MIKAANRLQLPDQRHRAALDEHMEANELVKAWRELYRLGSAYSSLTGFWRDLAEAAAVIDMMEVPG